MSLPKSLRYKPIGTPNYILIERAEGYPKLDSDSNSGMVESVALADMSADELAVLCDQWRATVFKKAKLKDPNAGKVFPATC